MLIQDIFLKKQSPLKSDLINQLYSKLKKICKVESISEERKNYLKTTVSNNGYLPYPHIKALEELSPAETLFALEIKWQQNNVFKDDKFIFKDNEISPLARNGIKDSEWIKKEGHDIKLINLAALGNGNFSSETGKFIDWLKQLLILPTGKPSRGIFNTTIYLLPFQEREFGCAYLPKSSDVSLNIMDSFIDNELGLNANEQVKLFITFAQLAGHPVIYDILPHTGRFSKIVLANPSIVRWFDVHLLMKKIETKTLEVATKLEEKFKPEDVNTVKNLFIKSYSTPTGNISGYYSEIYDAFEEELSDFKKSISEEMCLKHNQEKLVKRIKSIIAEVQGTTVHKKLEEEDIDKQGKCIEKLIDEGLWSAPGGAWCSVGIPVFEKMHECGEYPVFKHYDKDEKDVSEFANLDCQTPFYFVYLENGKHNKAVMDFYIQYIKKIRNYYNFDGIRVDHIDHVIDEISEKNGVSISYRAPRLLLQRLNKSLKAQLPYFVSIAEYMLSGNNIKEYHQNMGFDLLWGDDIIAQSDKTPAKIVEDNQNLANYNIENDNQFKVSILKTYNNQYGEFVTIDRYPGQLGFDGAMFKWFKYKFLPGGKFAQRPFLYADGDESFTTRGIEYTISNEVSMWREKNYDFFAKFDALNRFVKSQEIITEGEAQIIRQDEDGFVAWMISKQPLKTAFLVIANYKAPYEKFNVISPNGSTYVELRNGENVYEKSIQLPCDCVATAEYIFDGTDFSKVKFKSAESYLHFDKLVPSQFKIFILKK